MVHLMGLVRFFTLLLLLLFGFTSSSSLAHEKASDKKRVNSHLAHGVYTIPVVIVLQVDEDAVTKGVPVRLKFDHNRPNPRFGRGAEGLIEENFGKPVLTDRNSTATLWIKGVWGTKPDGDVIYNFPECSVIVGDPKAPWLKKDIAELVENKADLKTGKPPVLILKIPKKDVKPFSDKPAK